MKCRVAGAVFALAMSSLMIGTIVPAASDDFTSGRGRGGGSGSPPLAIGVDKGDLAVKANVEPGAVVDMILKFLNALGVRGAQVSLPPGGVLPGLSLKTSATGAVTVEAATKGCSKNSLCYWDEQNYEGFKHYIYYDPVGSDDQPKTRCINHHDTPFIESAAVSAETTSGVDLYQYPCDKNSAGKEIPPAKGLVKRLAPGQAVGVLLPGNFEAIESVVY